MSVAHRRVLPASEVRCHPSPSCPLQESCARYRSPLPQGIGSSLGNFADSVFIATSNLYECPKFLNLMVSDSERDEAAATARKSAIKPPLGTSVWPFQSKKKKP
jgi:hypothetical protein